MFVPEEKREKLLGLLKEIDRLDVYGQVECGKYWRDAEEPTCQGCVDFLINFYPEKKIDDVDIQGDDPYET
jgi:hypothetical protein